jgi:anti-sigma B factor antagonist
MSLTMKIENRMTGYFVIKLSGRLDGLTFTECEAQITPLLVPSTKVIMFDMTDLNYISSMGLRIILKAKKFAKGNDSSFHMINLQPQIERVFEITNMLGDMKIFVSVEEADQYFDAMQNEVLKKGS